MKKLARFLKFVAMGSFSLILTACYGVVAAMYGVPSPNLKDGRVRVQDTTGQPIPGLSVRVFSLYGPEIMTPPLTTDVNGDAFFQVDDQYGPLHNIVVEDIDGPANGGEFESTTESFDYYDHYSYIEVDLILSRIGENTEQISLKFVNSENLPIPGLFVEIIALDFFEPISTFSSDENGIVVLNYDLLSSGYQLRISDLDGPDNLGSFDPKNIVVDTYPGADTTLYITMEEIDALDF